MTSSQLSYLAASFVILFCIGTVLCLWQANWNTRKFFRSSLWVKIVFWIPIFIIFLFVLIAGAWAMLAVWLLIIIQAIKEWRASSPKNHLTRTYITLFLISAATAGASLFILPAALATNLLIIVCLASVLSDVFAYFFGTMLRKHPLPKFINPGKSWEGVAGQIAGAVVGLAVVLPIAPIPYALLFALIIGTGSTLGDIANSIAKRSIGIKDWGQTIPGHGGVLDRFSSLSFAFLLSVTIASTLW